MPDAHEELTYSATKTGDRDILPAGMMSVEEARARILDVIEVLPGVETPLLDALGLVLTDDIRSTFDIPPLANTGMDGYAVRSHDTTGASYDTPLTLRVTGYLAAGTVFEGRVGPGEAARIHNNAARIRSAPCARSSPARRMPSSSGDPDGPVTSALTMLLPSGLATRPRSSSVAPLTMANAASGS